jgi:hypothetical protein
MILYLKMLIRYLNYLSRLHVSTLTVSKVSETCNFYKYLFIIVRVDNSYFRLLNNLMTFLSV